MLDVQYTNQKASRNRKVNAELEAALKEVSNELGLDFEIFSGGQAPKGTKGSRYGKTVNHDDHGHGGGAADVKIKKGGKSFDLESDPELKKKLVTKLKEKGINEFGYGKGYMSGTSTMHIGNSNPTGPVRVWGSDSTSKTGDPVIKSAAGVSSSPTAGTKLVKEGTPSKVPSTPVFNSQMPAVRPPDVAEWSSSTLPKLDSRPTMTRMDNMPEGKGSKMVGKLIDVPTPALASTEGEPSSSTRRTVPKVGLGDMTPYLSNIANALQKPAPVPMPIMDRQIQLEKVNMDNDRFEIQKDYRGTMLNADRTLDGNTSVAVKQFGKAQKFAQMSAVNQAERNQNNVIGNKEITLNSSIAMGNNAKLYENRVNIADRENAIKRERSANFANATDKMVAQQNVKSQEDLENRKLDLLSGNDTYGTYQRMLDRAEEAKKKRETYGFGGKLGGRVPRFSAGSFMSKFKPLK